MEDIREIFTDLIRLPPNNMREHIDRDSIFELADDIKKNGLISPITVRPTHTNFGTEVCDIDLKTGICRKGHHNLFELVAGQRRYLAHQFAGILKIKCVVRELSDAEAFGIMTSENLARVDVNPVDEAKHIARLLEYNAGDVQKVSDIVRRGVAWVRDRIAVSLMPDYMQEFLANKEIKLGVALVLNQITDENIKRMWTLQAVRDGVNVQMAEYWLSDFKRQQLPGGSLAEPGAENINIAPPTAIMFTCAIDGQQYDVRLCKSVIIYEKNLDVFNAFVSAFRSPPAETALELGG